MKKNAIKLLGMIALILILNSFSFAEARSIYIGDDILLKIEDTSLTKEAIEGAFKDFRIDDIHATNTGYEVRVSPLLVGKQEVDLSSQKIIFDVKSTLDEIDRDGIFQMDLPTKASLNPNVVYILLLISGVTMLLTNGIYLWGRFKKEPVQYHSPYDVFLQICENNNEADKHLLGEFTKASKIYLSAMLRQSVIGLTSRQLSESSVMQEIDPTLSSAYLEWLYDCDTLKYQACDVTEEEFYHMKERLLRIVENLESYFLNKEGSVLEDAV